MCYAGTPIVVEQNKPGGFDNTTRLPSSTPKNLDRLQVKQTVFVILWLGQFLSSAFIFSATCFFGHSMRNMKVTNRTEDVHSISLGAFIGLVQK